jgi:serine/threonine protein kinase
MTGVASNIGDSLVGATLAGRYRVEARVGSGAMGAVYRAEQAGLGRRVALKIVNRDRHVGGDTVQRFRREAKALSALHHPNTVRVFDFGSTDEGLLFLAMELLEGEPLTDSIVREGALPVEQAVTITQQVLRSVGEAHARGIVHRDLKPDNIFLARVSTEAAPIVKVLDFGIAKAVEGDRKIDQFETLDGTVFGTPRYMSPEQAGGRQLDPRSDLYSVGILLYELVAGRPPFVDADAVVVMARHIREEPLPITRVAPRRSIPAGLEAVVSKALAKAPERRFQTAEEFEQALQACMPAVLRQARIDRGEHSARFPAWLTRTRAISAAAIVTIGVGISLSALGSMSNNRDTAHTQLQSALQPAAAGLASPRPAGSLDLMLPEDANNQAAQTPTSHVASVQGASSATALQAGSELAGAPPSVNIDPGARTSASLKRRGFGEHRVQLRAGEHTRLISLRRVDERERDQPKSAHRLRLHRSALPPSAASPANAPAAAPSPEARSPYEKF